MYQWVHLDRVFRATEMAVMALVATTFLTRQGVEERGTGLPEVRDM